MRKNGIEILREIKQSGVASKTIMMTSKGELEDKLLGFREGANDYIPKPFHVDELVSRVNAKLRIDNTTDNSKEFGDIVLDYSIPAIVSKTTGENIKINNKEFQLLELFIINHNQVLSKDLIFDRVGGMENYSLSNNLEAYISFVRRKLKMLDSRITIKTIRNMGYKLESADE